jgi:Fe2+ transport system protein FeoA
LTRINVNAGHMCKICETKNKNRVVARPKSAHGGGRRTMSADATFESGCVQPPRCEICPLTAVRAGMAVRIRRLCAAPEIQDRLRELGFCEDQIIRLLANRTNFICQICNARLAISEQLARLIWVEPVLQPVAAPKSV